MEQVPEAVATARLQDTAGREHELRELWRERTGVLVFLRHFGCMLCREQAIEVHRERPAFQAKGSELHLIGPGSPEQGAIFLRVFDLACPLWVDPKLATFRALQMKRGFWRTLGSPSNWKAVARAFRAGFRQGATAGDLWQVGGVLVVRTDGGVLYHYLSAFSGDHPRVAAILAALP